MLRHLDILLLAIFAGYILLRLFNVLGKRTGQENRDFVFPKDLHQDEKPRNQVGDSDRSVPAQHDIAPAKPADSRLSKKRQHEKLAPYIIGGAKIEKALEALISTWPEFDPAEFLEGAKVAYELIISNFVRGNKKVLRSLLDKSVYESFKTAIDQREKKRQKMALSIIQFKKAHISSVFLQDNRVDLQVRFQTDMTSYVEGEKGEIVEGDKKTIRSTKDSWTFSRKIDASDPNWQLIATGAA